MWIIKSSKAEAEKMILEKIPTEKVFEAHMKLSDEAMTKRPVKHHDNLSGPGDQQIAKDLVDACLILTREQTVRGS